MESLLPITKTYTLSCKYCGHQQEWEFHPENFYECQSVNDVLDFDQEYECKGCGCSVRYNEALPDTILEEEGYL